MESDIELGPNAARNVNVSVPVEVQAYPSDREAHGQPQAQSEKSFSDSSGPLFSMYLERAEEEDRRMVENWKGDADGILVFTGLFSASVAAFVGNTYQGLQLNSQDASAFYLSRIYQQSVPDNGSQVSLPLTISDPATFSPSNTTVWVNALWFLSLVISLTCALLTTMLQQWARHYLRVTQTRYQPYKRARIRSFYAEGVEKFRVSWAIDALPALLHLSVFLFYAGLSVLLFTTNITIFKVVVSWVALCISLYLIITMMPVILHDCPYRTPLSTLTWTFALVVLRLAADAMKFISGIFSSTLTAMITARRRFDKLANSLRVLAARGMLKSAEETAMKQPPGIDSRALAWTYDSLDEDHELEQFLAGVPGILNSEAMKQPELVLANVDIFRHRGHLINETLALMRRSARLSHSAEAAQRRRFEVCSNAAFAILPICPRFSKGQYWNTTDAKFATLLRLLERITKLPDHDVAFSAECMAFLVSQWTIIPNAILSSQVLSRTIHFPGLSPSGPLNHANVNNELTLHFIRRIALPYLDEPSNKARAKVVTTTLRHLSTEDLFSHDLCDIWNRVVQMPSDEDKDRVAVYILACLAPFYSACHLQSSWLTSARLNDVEDYDELIKCERSTFPSCTEDGHRLRPTYLLRTPIHSRGSQSAGERQIVTSPEPTAQSPPASEFPYRFSGGNHARDHVPDKRSGPRDCAGFPGTSKVRCLISTLTSSPPADLLVLSTESSSQSHQPATLVAVPTRPAVVPLPVGPADAGGSPQSAGAAPAASSAFGPDSLSNDDCLQGRGGVTAALQ